MPGVMEHLNSLFHSTEASCPHFIAEGMQTQRLNSLAEVREQFLQGKG